jgi:hypothetical protein
MGKIISGIAAVFVFQVAFIWYMSSSAPENAAEIASAVKPSLSAPATANIKDRASETPASSGEDATDDVSSDAETVTEERSSARSIAAKRPNAGSSAASGVRVNKAFRPRSIRVIERMPFPTRVIYIPARENYNSRPRPRAETEYTPKYTMELTDRPSGTVAKVTREASRPRKRPFIARAFPALVKKPWNWMKSLVAKLD